MTADDQRENFKKWLEKNGLSPFSVAKAAGVSPGAIYNFLSGTSNSLSTAVLQKISMATGQPVDTILTGSSPALPIVVRFRIGAMGKMFSVDDDEYLTIARPPGVAAGEDLTASLVDGDGLLPIPGGWYVFFRTRTEAPEALLNQMAVVRFSGGGDRPVVRTIRASGTPGLFTLQAMSGALVEDVEIVAAHRVVSFSKPVEPSA